MRAYFKMFKGMAEKSSGQKNQFQFCPTCQVPLQALKISPSIHAASCVIDWVGLDECCDGADCLNVSIFHYRDYSHNTLAAYRSSKLYIDPVLEMKPSPKKRNLLKKLKSPKLKLSPPPPATSSSDSESDILVPLKRSRRALVYSDSDSFKERKTGKPTPKTDLNHGNELTKVSKKSAVVEKRTFENQTKEPTSKKKSKHENVVPLISKKLAVDKKTEFEKPIDLARISGINEQDEINQFTPTSVGTQMPVSKTKTKSESKQKENNRVRHEKSECHSGEDLFDSDITEFPDFLEAQIDTNLVRLDTSPIVVCLENEPTRIQVRSMRSLKSLPGPAEALLKPPHLSSGGNQSGFETQSKKENGVGSRVSGILNEPHAVSSSEEMLPHENNKSKEWKHIVNRMRERNVPSDLKVSSDEISTTSSSDSHVSDGDSSKGRVLKRCPFYKRIPGAPFVVDAFQYGSIPGVRAYFLSHFHSDHYIGLRKSFAHPIYSSQVTANLVRTKLGVNPKWLNILVLGETRVISGIEVVTLDANHCPGSVMFLFRLANSRNYLHVGDFRAHPGMESEPLLKKTHINQLFLDTTYCDARYDFPTQEEVIAQVKHIVIPHVAKHPRTLVVCGSYTIGKEKVFLAVAEALGWKVWVRPDKRRVLECLEDNRISARLTVQAQEANVHVLPMKELSLDLLRKHIDLFPGVYTHMLAFKPTGWETNRCTDKVSVNNIAIYGVPYSEHSSFSELRRFVQFVRPDEVVPTVNVGSVGSRTTMRKHFTDWLYSAGGGTSQSDLRHFIQPA